MSKLYRILGWELRCKTVEIRTDQIGGDENILHNSIVSWRIHFQIVDEWLDQNYKHSSDKVTRF